MADGTAERKEETEIGAEAARIGLTELMGRAAFAGERFILTRNGKPAAALVPIKDLERLRELDAEQSEKVA
jgi:prevent-host-death family protein